MFDRVEVGRIRRQKQKRATVLFGESGRARGTVEGGVIEDDDRAGSERRKKNVLEIHVDNLLVAAVLEDHGREKSVVAVSANHARARSVAAACLAVHLASAHGTPALPAQSVVDSAFVNVTNRG